MTHYVLIDNASGYVWGDAHAADPVAACRAVDADQGVLDRDYSDAPGIVGTTATGYRVHVAPEGFDLDAIGDGDGQNEALIAAVSALPRVAVLECRQREPIMVTLVNPYTHATVERDVSGLSQTQLDHYASLMDDDLREELHMDLAPCTPGEFVAAWAKRVGPEQAGGVILGS